jgi:hypothetical protein
MIRTDLTGPTGALKLKIIKAQGDEFLAYAVPEPRTEQNMRRAAEAGERLADMSGAVVQSLKALASEFPGVGTALEGTGEALAATKHLLGWRWWPWRRR